MYVESEAEKKWVFERYYSLENKEGGDLEKEQPIERCCLTCSHLFYSIHKHNRICEECIKDIETKEPDENCPLHFTNHKTELAKYEPPTLTTATSYAIIPFNSKI